MRFILFILLNLIIFSGFSQKYYFRTFSLEEGLPQSEISDLFIDSRGIMWFGTNGGGLCRFNGFGFDVLNKDNGLINNQVNKIFEDHNNNLLLFTSKGISRYDGSKFINTPFQAYNPSLRVLVIEDQIDKNSLWVIYINADSNKLFKYKNDSITEVPINTIGLTNNMYIYSEINLQDGNVLINTRLGIYEFKNNKFVRSFYLDNFDIDAQLKIPVYQDKNGTLYIIGISNNVKGKLFTVSNNIVKEFPLPDDFYAQTITNIYYDNSQNLWISSRNNGVLRFNGTKTTHYNSTNGLPGNTISGIVEDNEGNIWIGTLGAGLTKFQGDYFTIIDSESGLSEDLIRSIFQDSQGNYWFGTSSKGIVKFDGKKYQYFNSNIFPLVNVFQIFEPHKGEIIAVNFNFIYRFDGQKFVPINREFHLKRGWIISGITYANDKYWINIRGIGVYVTDGKTTKIYSANNDSLASNFTLFINADSKGNIWSCSDNGLTKISESGIKIYQNDLFSEGIVHFTEDNAGNYWFATFGNVVLRLKGEKFEKFQVDSGLSSNLIYSVIKDSNGAIWAGTQKGVDKIVLDQNSDVKEIINYSIYDGFTGIETNNGAIFSDKEENIWFGTIKGAIKYSHRKDSINNVAPITRIKCLRLFYEVIKWDTKPFNKFCKGIIPWTNLPDCLELPYTHNHITFSFESSSYKVPEKVKYQWILEGYDNEWSPISDKREVTYPKLPYGNYTFKVRSANNCGIWTNQTAEYQFKITAPFTQTTAFYIILTFLIFAIVLVIMRLRIHVIKMKKKELEKIVADKTREILDQSKAMLEKNRMLEKQKREIEIRNQELEELNNEKNHIIGIVAHDLRNPLTSSLTIANILKSSPEIMSADQSESVSFMVHALERMNNMINRILDIRVIEQKKLNINLEDTNLDELIRFVISNFKEKATQKNQIINYSSEIKDVIIFLDKNYTLQVFENLISNAIKFSPLGKMIIVKLFSKDDKLVTEIRDEGPGINNEEQKMLFKKFQRLSTKPTGNEKSTGLGLSIVKKFVEAMNGNVWCQSEPGNGTSFFVEFSKKKEMEMKND